jgi:outer membrane lipoprotein SlyB
MPMDLPQVTTRVPSARRSYWLGAISYEVRCVGSLRKLEQAGHRPTSGILLDYRTNLLPRTPGERMRADNRKSMVKLVKAPRVRPYDAYRFGPMMEALLELDQEANGHEIVLDITCLTKMHTLALSLWLVERKTNTRVTIAYTRPRTYQTPDRAVWRKSGWTDTVVSPLGFGEGTQSSTVLGLLALGHEGDRLRLAWDAMEADSGVALMAKSDDPRLRVVVEAQNNWLLSDLSGNRIRLEHLAWQDMATAGIVAEKLARAAKHNRVRLCLYPFGPKPIVLGAALAAASTYPTGTWFVYPVPACHDVDETDGIGDTYWYRFGIGRDEQ